MLSGEIALKNNHYYYYFDSNMPSSGTYLHIGTYWSCGYNVGFKIQRLQVRSRASVCCVREQDTLSTLLQSTQL